MLVLFTFIIMAAVGYAQFRNGLFSSFAMLIMVVLSGLFAFELWEPIADLIEPSLQGTFLGGTEDFIVLVVLYCIALSLMRWGTNYLAPLMIDYHGYVQLAGAGVVGVLTGYLVAGFLACALQTLPLHENFLGFEMYKKEEGGMRSIFPPDMVWLALMRHAGAFPFSSETLKADADYPYDRYRTFDHDATYELRYLRYRRSTETRSPLPYGGEFDRAIDRSR
jgi:hypothetical protein